MVIDLHSGILDIGLAQDSLVGLQKVLDVLYCHHELMIVSSVSSCPHACPHACP